jgi:hypothetical protein
VLLERSLGCLGDLHLEIAEELLRSRPEESGPFLSQPDRRGETVSAWD